MSDDGRRLYPLRFVDEGSNVFWGRVVYQIADLGFMDTMVADGWFGGNTLSELMGTYLERVVGDDAFEFYGLQFPVMVKLMSTAGWQPLKVNISDDDAAQRYDSFGKTALWYVQEAAEGSEIVLGFNRKVDAGEFYSRCESSDLREVLNIVHPKAGDSFLIRPGTVYAAGPGLKIVEIAESSELSFDIHNWGAPLPDGDEVLLDEAFDLIDFNEYVPVQPEGGRLASCPEFIVTRHDLTNALHIFSETPGSFAVYYCVSGELSIQVPSPDNAKGRFDSYPLKAGHSLLVPSEVNDIYLVPSAAGTAVLEALVEKRLVKDSYTSAEVEPNALGDLPEEPDPHIREWK